MLSPHSADIRARLICPRCSSPFSPLTSDKMVCSRSGHEFQIHDGIPRLAIFDEAVDQATGESAPQPAEDYQRQYEDLEAAAAYNQEYKDYLLKRMSTQREFKLLERLLSTQPRSRSLLELPCGGGRVTPALAAHAELLIEADIGLGQVLYGRKTSKIRAPQAWLTASANRIPFPDASIDGIVCIRLCHHLPLAEQRERLVAELLRVASRFVIMTFFDYRSLKNRLRQLRQPFNKKPPKSTMRIEELAELASQNKARLVEYPALSWIGSGHRYALMVKN